MTSWINKERTVLVRLFDNGNMQVILRDDSDQVWGPPIMVEEKPWP